MKKKLLLGRTTDQQFGKPRLDYSNQISYPPYPILPYGDWVLLDQCESKEVRNFVTPLKLSFDNIAPNTLGKFDEIYIDWSVSKYLFPKDIINLIHNHLLKDGKMYLRDMSDLSTGGCILVSELNKPKYGLWTKEHMDKETKIWMDNMEKMNLKLISESGIQCVKRYDNYPILHQDVQKEEVFYECSL